MSQELPLSIGQVQDLIQAPQRLDWQPSATIMQALLPIPESNEPPTKEQLVQISHTFVDAFKEILPYFSLQFAAKGYIDKETYSSGELEAKLKDQYFSLTLTNPDTGEMRHAMLRNQPSSYFKILDYWTYKPYDSGHGVHEADSWKSVRYIQEMLQELLALIPSLYSQQDNASIALAKYISVANAQNPEHMSRETGSIQLILHTLLQKWQDPTRGIFTRRNFTPSQQAAYAHKVLSRVNRFMGRERLRTPEGKQITLYSEQNPYLGIENENGDTYTPPQNNLLYGLAALGTFVFKHKEGEISSIPAGTNRQLWELLALRKLCLLKNPMPHITVADVELVPDHLEITDVIVFLISAGILPLPIRIHPKTAKDIEGLLREVPDEVTLKELAPKESNIIIPNSLYFYVAGHKRRLKEHLKGNHTTGVEIRYFPDPPDSQKRNWLGIEADLFDTYEIARFALMAYQKSPSQRNNFETELATAWVNFIRDWKKVLKDVDIYYPRLNSRSQSSSKINYTAYNRFAARCYILGALSELEGEKFARYRRLGEGFKARNRELLTNFRDTVISVLARQYGTI